MPFLSDTETSARATLFMRRVLPQVAMHDLLPHHPQVTMTDTSTGRTEPDVPSDERRVG
jgi:hypothetical protein